MSLADHTPSAERVMGARHVKGRGARVLKALASHLHKLLDREGDGIHGRSNLDTA